MAEFWKEIESAATKVSTYLLGILVGLMGKISFDIISGKKITLPQLLASAGLAFAMGIGAAELCDYKHWEEARTVITIAAALLSEKIAIVIFAMITQKNIGEWLRDLARKFPK
jgi:hypothetical protein